MQSTRKKTSDSNRISTTVKSNKAADSSSGKRTVQHRNTNYMERVRKKERPPWLAVTILSLPFPIPCRNSSAVAWPPPGHPQQPPDGSPVGSSDHPCKQGFASDAQSVQELLVALYYLKEQRKTKHSTKDIPQTTTHN